MLSQAMLAVSTFGCAGHTHRGTNTRLLPYSKLDMLANLTYVRADKLAFLLLTPLCKEIQSLIKLYIS